MMKIDITDIRDYLIDKLQENDLKYEVHTFESCAIIIDIWINDRFYVAQIDTDNLGISEIKDG